MNTYACQPVALCAVKAPTWDEAGKRYLDAAPAAVERLPCPPKLGNDCRPGRGLIHTSNLRRAEELAD
jgi:hypothetical protein